ncbi:MAG: type II secretion system protein [Lachnospiraceae bacterium]|nr:type II secretion system protein [Lachnospiraceae bacterium]
MKKKNEGFTLVELVIAIVILAIAVSPLLSNFIQSSKMNLKSRKQLNALNLAQDIMEGMSQYTAQENAEYFFLASVSDNTILEDKRVLPGGTTVTGCSGQVATVSNNTLTNISAPMPKDWTKFVYNVTGIQTASGNYNNYDMKITIDSTSVSTNVDAGGKTPQEIASMINGKEYADIAQVDQYFDAVNTIKADDEENAYKQLRQKSTKPATELSDYKGKVSRTISINFVNSGTEAAPDYAVKVITTYKVLDSAKTALGFTGTHADEASTTYVDKTENLSKAESTVMPRSLYLYFSGLSGANSSNREKIEINNTTNQPVVVYLLRNVDGNTLSQNGVPTYNTNYACDVYVNSKVSSDPLAATVDNVEIVSNLRHNFCFKNNKRVYKEGTTEKLDGITDTDVAETHYSRDRSLIYYNSSTEIGNNPAQGNNFYEKYIFDGYRKIQRNVLFDVKIEIFESGKTKSIASYTGGLSN